MEREIYSAPMLRQNRLRTSYSHAFSNLNFFRRKDQDQVLPDPQKKQSASLQELSPDFQQLKGLVEIRNLTPYELLEIKGAAAEDNLFKLASIRLTLSISQICSRIVGNSLFEFFILSVILANTITLAMQTPNQTHTNLEQAERIFLWIYTWEAVLKMLGTGLFTGKNAYFRQKGNILDFVIVVMGWVQVLAEEGLNLSAVRAIRIFRPLKSISSIQGMRVIFKVLMQSMKLLFSTLVILFFVFLVFAIAGLNLWMGVMRFRCLDLNSGVLENQICGIKMCSPLKECVEGLENPNYGVTNFDNIFYSMLIVFQVVTLEGWADIMILTQKAFSYWSFLYFIPLMFLGGFFLINITLAVIKMKFTDIKSKEFSQEKKVQEQKYFMTTVTFDHQSMCVPQNFNQSSMESMTSMSPLKLEKFKQIPDTLKIVQQNSDLGIMSSRKATSVFENFHPSLKLRDSTHEKGLDATLMEEFKEENGNFASGDKEIKLVMKRSELINLTSDSVLKKKFEKEEPQQFKFNIIQDIQLNFESKNDILPVQQESSKKISKFYYFQYINPQKTQTKSENPFCFLYNKLCQKQAYYSIVLRAKSVVSNTFLQDSLSNNILGEWSCGDVTYNLYQQIPSSLISMNYRLWRSGFIGSLQKFQHLIFLLISQKIFNYLMTLCVIFNTILLAMDHHGISPQINQALNLMNLIFTSIFTAEMALKLTGLGVKGYFRDNMNYIDSLVVILSLFEIIFISQSSALSAFRTIRIFRTFRILRVARLFRYLQELSKLIEVIGRSITTSLYLALLLLVFIMIFALLGMEIFGGKFDFPEGKPRANFDNFHEAFVTVFQLLSTQNWYSILFDGIRATSPIAALFFVVWIFLGNFVLLNLFLAILLDSFVAVGKTEAGYQRSRFFRRRQTAIYNLPSPGESVDSQQSLPLARRAPDDQYQKVQKSVCIFTQSNWLRRFCSNLIQSNHFQQVVLVIIVFCSIKLVFDTYIIESDQNSIQKELSYIADIVFTLMFTLEMAIKIISKGFLLGPKTYLRNSWNVLDMFIVLISIIQLIVENQNISAVKVLRMLRTLRPLRFITHNIEMKIVVNALINSLTAIFNVGIVILIVWMMFAILGVSFFGGKFYQCENPEIEWEVDCLKQGYQWVNSDSNYDNVIEGMMTLFIVSSLEGWPDIMYQSIDVTEVGRAPKKNFQPLYAYYYVAFILIGSFFFLNLFIGALFKSFENAKQSQKAEYTLVLTRAQQKWHQILKMIPASKPLKKVADTPTNKFRKCCYTISNSVYFDLFILGCIIVNMVQMAIIYQQASSQYLETLETINLALTCVFIVEGIVKIIGLGPKSYFAYSWNKFDFFVICTSITEIIIAQTADSQITLLRTGPQLARVFRVLRVTKLLRVVKSLKDVQAILETIQFSLTSIINVLSLLLLIYFIYAILGVFLFYQVDQGTIIGEYTNFFNFGNAMLTLFRISSGQEWNLVMYDCAKKNAPAAYTYFISYQVISGYIMLNLFIMVLLQTVDDHFQNPESPIDIFKRTIKHFKKVWSQYSVLHAGQKIHHKLMIDLMYDLGSPLGVSSDMPRIQVAKLITSLSIPTEDSGYIYYHDILFSLYKKKYGTYRFNSIDRNQEIILMKQQRATLRKINEMKKQFLNQKKTYEGSRNEFFQQNFVINPFQTYIVMRKVFVSWFKWTKQRKLNRVDQSEEGQDESGLSDLEKNHSNNLNIIIS